MQRTWCLFFWILTAFTFESQATDPLVFKQVYDDQLVANKKSKSMSNSPLIGQPLPVEMPIIIGRNSRIEVANKECTARIGGASQFLLNRNNDLKLSQGAVLLVPKTSAFKISMATEKCAFSVEGVGALAIESTSNGACKIMSLSSSTTIALSGGAKKTLAPGNLLFLLPGKQEFGPIVDIDLKVLFATSTLITGFERPLERIKDIRFAAFYQNYRIKGRSNALIGDANNEKNYQVIFVK